MHSVFYTMDNSVLDALVIKAFNLSNHVSKASHIIEVQWHVLEYESIKVIMGEG